MMGGLQQMTAHAKEILDDAVDRRKALEVSSRLEAAHLAFPLSRGFV